MVPRWLPCHCESQASHPPSSHYVQKQEGARFTEEETFSQEPQHTPSCSLWPDLDHTPMTQQHYSQAWLAKGYIEGERAQLLGGHPMVPPVSQLWLSEVLFQWLSVKGKDLTRVTALAVL